MQDKWLRQESHCLQPFYYLPESGLVYTVIQMI